MRGLDRLHPNSVSLYYDKDSKGGVTASVLVEAALRMRIGRLFLQEIRDGVGAIAFLLALQTGHTGGITTIHASDCLAVFDRLRVLVKQAPGGASISDTDITTQLRSLVDVIVHAGRDGSTFKVDEVWFRACPEVMGKSDERGVAALSGESGAVAGDRAGVSEPPGSSAMKRVPVAAGVLVGGVAGWTVAASYLFVQFGGLGGKLERPWLAWWLYAANSPDGWTVALLAASAALPLVFGRRHRSRGMAAHQGLLQQRQAALRRQRVGLGG